MNSKLREILESVVDWAESGRTSMGRPNALEPDQAEKAIRQAVAEEMLELIDDIDKPKDGVMTWRTDSAWQQRDSLKTELRQKIKEWQGGEDE